MSALIVEKLSKTFRVPKRKSGFRGALQSFFHREHVRVEAVKDLSFEIGEGEIVGFLGPNGAGKTTTLKMISGLLYPDSDSGKILTLGHVPQKRERDFLKQITLVMGNRSQLWWEIPVEETLRLNKEIYELSDAFYRESLGELVRLLDLSELLGIPTKKLSLGQRMKAELACALLHRPKFLLLDEPTLGLDIVMQKKIRQFLLDYNQRRRATILLTSHNMDDVAELCQRVLIIDKGQTIYDGSFRQLIERYAPDKRVRVDFAESPRPEAIKEFDLALANGGASGLCAEARVPRSQVSRFASRLLENAGGKLPAVVDLTIEETPVEDVIRKIFVHE
ncbi:MAG: ATP-binding cassette domain-containing protein [Elusimicrobia bacterium]|nr:ATP-binding cassette domain-containing protein [Elusimicrobiota bacterium]